MRLNLFAAVVSHFIVMTTCLLEERKHVVLHFDSEDTEASSDNLDFKVKDRVFRSANHQGRKLSMWGSFMTFVHCHSPGDQHAHCHSHHHHHMTGTASHSNESGSGCNNENCQTGCYGGQCYDADDNACDGENCGNGYYSQLDHPTPSPSTEISNDMCWYCIGNNSSGFQSNNMEGIVYGGLGFAGVGIIASLALRKRNKQNADDHLLSGAVNKRMKTLSDRFKKRCSPSFTQTSMSFEDSGWGQETVTDYYKA